MQNDLIPADVDITEETVTQTSEQVAEEPVAYTSEEAAEEAKEEVITYEAVNEAQDTQDTQAAFGYTSTSEEEEEDLADESEAELTMNGQPRIYAGFFTRLTAYLLDKLILLIPLGLVRLIMAIISMAINVNILHRQVFFKVTPADMILYCITAIYFILMTYLTGRTIGKRIMRIQVVSTEDRKPTFLEILFRETFGRFLSTFILCIGYLMIIAGKEKQALHDYLADTRVIFDCNR